MFKNILVLLFVVGLHQASVDGSAGLRFSGSSYAEYDPWSWFPNATLQFFFQTSEQKRALLFYQDDAVKGAGYYYMCLFLTRSGFAKFRARLGPGTEEREIHHNFADSKWQKVRIKIDRTKLYFTIEDENGLVNTAEPPVEISASAQTGAKSVLFIAGIPLSSSPMDFSAPKFFFTFSLAMFEFEGCIGDIRVYRPSSGQLDKVKLRKSANAEDTCVGACSKVGCYNGGRCIDRIWHSECDCSATGFRGDRCQTRSHTAFLNTPDERGGYISQSLNDNSPLMNTERNTVSFMFSTEKKNGVFFYMGREKDHLVVELVNGSLRVEADVGGGPIGVFANESNLADSCWHHVEVRRKKARLTVIIDKEKYGKIRQESSPTYIKLNLNNKTSNVIYYGGGPSEKLWFAQAKPLYFTGFLKQFYFEEINVIENALISQRKGFKISDPLGVGIVEKNNLLLQSAEYNCRPELVGSGCFSDDDTDLSCIPSTTTPTKGSHTARLNVPQESEGYIFQTLSNDSPFMDTERNTIQFMFLTEKKNGVFFYMGSDKDHLVVELVNGSLRVAADVGGGPIVVFDESNYLSDSCWHHVEVRRRKARLTVIIDKEKSRKSSESSTSHFKLNLNNNTSNVIYYGGGPSDKLVFAKTKPLYFRGFLKQFYFEQINVIDKALTRPKNARRDFEISDWSGVGIAVMKNFLLQSAERKCIPDPTSGCSPDDDDSDPSCNPSTTTPTKDTTKSTTVSSPTPTGTTTKTQSQVPRQLQNPTPRSKGVSAWVIIVIVLAAMAVVLITVFLLYRWNHRYTGSFKPSKSEEAQSQDPGADAEQQQGSWMYNQPPFFVYKPAKKTTKAQSPPVSI